MARRVFFSFHYQRDVWRANVVRNSGVVIGSAAAGFHDASLWEEAKKKGDAAIKKLIDGALENTSVTAVLIGAKTAGRKYINYEIDKSIERGNGIFGIHIHNIKDSDSKTDTKGEQLLVLTGSQAPGSQTDLEEHGPEFVTWAGVILPASSRHFACGRPT